MKGSRCGIVIVAVCALFAGGCRSPTRGTGPLDGTWTGTVADTGVGVGTATLTIQQRGAAIDGTFTTTFGGVVSRNGAVTGTSNGSSLGLSFTPPVPLVCAPGVTLSGTLTITLTVTGSRLVGSYAGLSCGGAVTATLELAMGG